VACSVVLLLMCSVMLCVTVTVVQWVFWFGPILGALSGGVLYEYCFHEGGYKVDMLIDMYILRK
jgi:glycerol uptake facilitator-like aquaporin